MGGASRQHVVIQLSRVVEAQSQHLVAVERLIDQRLVLDAGQQLIVGSARPDQLADDPHLLIKVLLGEGGLDGRTGSGCGRSP